MTLSIGQNFFTQSPALARIETLSKDQTFLNQKRNTLYFNRWEIVKIWVTAPFAIFFHLFLLAAAKIFHALSLEKLQRISTILSKHTLRELEQLEQQFLLQKRLLVPAFNTHTISSLSVFCQGPIPINSLPKEIIPLTFRYAQFLQAIDLNEKEEEAKLDRQLLALLEQDKIREVLALCKKQMECEQGEKSLDLLYTTICQGKMTINFFLYHPKGACRGSCYWFLLLYHSTEHLFTDPEKHLIAVAEQFRKGISKQGAVLQGLNEGCRILGKKAKSDQTTSLSTRLLDLQPEVAKKKILSLLPGAYRVGVLNHSILYFKFDSQKGYVWDPNVGLYRSKANEFCDHLLQNVHKKQNPHSTLYFEKLYSI